MSLSASAINSMLGSHSNIFKQSLPFTPTPKIVRKHYSDHEPHEHHEEHHYTKKQSRSVALTALTLLAFLFFLHILQQCLHDQVEMSTTPTTLIMQANVQAKEGAQNMAKEAHEAQDRLGESPPDEEPQLTTPFGFGSDEGNMATRRFTEGTNLYQYEKVHIPVKMKVVEKPVRVKTI